MLLPLPPFAVVMAIDHGTAKLRADAVKLIAEMRHLIRAVFIAGNDLVDRVYDNGNVLLLCRPANELRRELVHRDRLAAQVPYIDVVEVFGLPAERRVNVPEAVQAACAVKLEVHIQDLSPRADPAEPPPPFRDRAAELDERIALPRLARPGKKHLVPLPQHPFDQRWRKLRQIVPGIGHALRFRQVVVYALDPFLPFRIARLADVGIHKELLAAVPGHARHAGQAGGIAVLAIDLEPVFLADGIEIVHAPAVFLVTASVDLYDGMQALSAAVHKAGNGKLQLADYGVLRLDLHRVRFHKRVAVLRYVFVLYAVSVERVEADPRARFRVIIADHAAHIPAVFAEQLDQLAGRPVIAAFFRQEAAVLFVAARHIAHVFGGLKQRLQIGGQLPHRIPVLRLVNLLALHPIAVYDHKLVIRSDGGLPVEFRIHFSALRLPALVLCKLDDRSRRYRGAVSMEAVPLAEAFSRMVPGMIPLAPRIPIRSGIPFLFERHAHGEPFLVVELRGVERLQHLPEVVAFVYHDATSPNSARAGIASGTYSPGRIPFGTRHPFAAIRSIRRFAS